MKVKCNNKCKTTVVLLVPKYIEDMFFDGRLRYTCKECLEEVRDVPSKEGRPSESDNLQMPYGTLWVA